MSKIKYIDLHRHIDLYSDMESIINECEKKKILTIAVTTTPRAWNRNFNLMNNMKYVRPALGLHPQIIDENFMKELELWEKYIDQTKYVGEVGLDGRPEYIKNMPDQIKVFKKILKTCSEYNNKIISVHTSSAATEAIDLIEKFLKTSKGKIILHWFTGNAAEIARAVAIGCYFSVNSKMLSTAKGRNALKLIPSELVLTETDGPFIEAKPEQNLDFVHSVLMESWKMNDGQLMTRLTANLKNLIR